MDGTICRFAPAAKAPDVIQIIHFVYETAMGGRHHRGLETAYKLCLVVSGSAGITCYGQQHRLAPGDLYFVFPAVPYTLDTSEDFTFLYISFLGLRANQLLDRLQISSKHFVFPGYEDLLPFWMDSIRTGEVLPELAAESVLLHALMKLGNAQHLAEGPQVTQSTATMLLVKRAIDEGFASPELSAQTLAQQFGYHRKYICSAFKKNFKVGIQDYLTQLRINRACLLMGQGYSCVKDIAYLCGYMDPLYFSKVFRKKMGLSPMEYMQNVKK